MEFDAVIGKRRSVRGFSGKAKWDDVMAAVDAAMQGPFSGNHNNLNFLIVENKDSIAAIAQHCEQEWIADAGTVVVVCSDDTHLENMYGERGRVYSRQQAGATIYGFLLKLVDLGLDGCWIGAYEDDEIRDLLKIPGKVQIEAIIPVGRGGRGGGTKARKKSLEAALFWEVWGRDKRPSLFEEDESDNISER